MTYFCHQQIRYHWMASNLLVPPVLLYYFKDAVIQLIGFNQYLWYMYQSLAEHMSSWLNASSLEPRLKSQLK